MLAHKTKKWFGQMRSWLPVIGLAVLVTALPVSLLSRRGFGIVLDKTPAFGWIFYFNPQGFMGFEGYTIGILGGERLKRARRALTMLADQTGGVTYFPKDLSEVDEISRQVARDIRNQYVIGYKPSAIQHGGVYRQVRVEARASGYKRLQVRTRSGYYATQSRRAAAH
jgi:hypothetical protein